MRGVADGILAGNPCDSVAVTNAGVFIVAGPFSADRWRTQYGDTIAGFPLTVIAVDLGWDK